MSCDESVVKEGKELVAKKKKDKKYLTPGYKRKRKKYLDKKKKIWEGNRTAEAGRNNEK